MAMLRMIAGGTTLIAAVLSHQAVQAQTAQQCDLRYSRAGVPVDLEPEILISGCTAVIQSGNRSGHDLAMAFTVRGLGYRRTFLFELAFEDFNEAINVDPRATTVVEFRDTIARDTARWKAVAAKANIKLD